MRIARLFVAGVGVAVGVAVGIAVGPAAPRPLAAQAAPSANDLPLAFVRRSTTKSAGKFYGPAEIAKLRQNDTPRLLARISGGDVREFGGGDLAIISRRGNRNTFNNSIENEVCRIGIVVNDARVPDGYDLKGVSLGELVAVEFYAGPASVPPELNTSGPDAVRCGLLALWIKGR
ncbi:MAG: hypothetical protein FJ202_01195 [Gemmatimonadetes bacterium]|nr:hypothetical protein [Gemmatimonadota bacterium]